jgi:CheY-like chemotaxis protein
MNRPILLIEDNEHNRYLLAFLLEQSGYQVVSAADGITGIELAMTINPIAVVLDIQLPIVDGYTVARQLRKTPGLDSVPIIAVTSYAMTGDQEMALAAGCNAYIEKPIVPETFIAEISAFLPAASLEKAQ